MTPIQNNAAGISGSSPPATLRSDNNQASHSANTFSSTAFFSAGNNQLLAQLLPLLLQLLQQIQGQNSGTNNSGNGNGSTGNPPPVVQDGPPPVQPPVIADGTRPPPPPVVQDGTRPPPPVVADGTRPPPPVIADGVRPPPPPVVQDGLPPVKPPVIADGVRPPPPPVVQDGLPPVKPPVIADGVRPPPPPVVQDGLPPVKPPVIADGVRPPPPPVVQDGLPPVKPPVIADGVRPPPPVIADGVRPPPPPQGIGFGNQSPINASYNNGVLTLNNANVSNAQYDDAFLKQALGEFKNSDQYPLAQTRDLVRTPWGYSGSGSALTAFYNYLAQTHPNGGSVQPPVVQDGPTIVVPPAIEDNVSTPRDTPTRINVVSNDVGGNENKIASFTQPANGTVTQVGNDLVYTPNQGYTGNDTFSYTTERNAGDNLTVGSGASVNVQVIG